jgi:mono/diheme cytochrome c family protein
MNRNLLAIALLALSAGTAPLLAADPRLELGEKLFKVYCAECHAKGGNIYRSTKTLSRKDLTANRISTVEDVIRLIRNPGSSMHRFGPTQMPGEEADAVAFYVLEVFNK